MVLYDKDKSYYDYYFDLKVLLHYQSRFAHSSFLGSDIKELAQENDIPIRVLDENDNILRDLEKEIEKLEEGAEVENSFNSSQPLAKLSSNEIEITKETINVSIVNIEAMNYFIEKNEKMKEAKRAQHKEGSKPMISIYKKEDWRIFKSENDPSLKKRNESWVEKILLSLENEAKPFIAGGVKHFVGSDNVIDMLENEGFKITKIEDNCQF